MKLVPILKKVVYLKYKLKHKIKGGKIKVYYIFNGKVPFVLYLKKYFLKSALNENKFVK